MPCELLNGSSSLPSSVQLLHCYVAFACGSDSVTTGWSLVFNSLVCCSLATTASWNSPTGSVPILSDYNTVLLPTAFLRTGLAFALQRVKPNPSLFRWTIAGGSLWETCLWSSCLLYPLWTLNRPSIPFVISNYVTNITSFVTMSTTFLKKFKLICAAYQPSTFNIRVSGCACTTLGITSRNMVRDKRLELLTSAV